MFQMVIDVFKRFQEAQTYIEEAVPQSSVLATAKDLSHFPKQMFLHLSSKSHRQFRDMGYFRDELDRSILFDI